MNMKLHILGKNLDDKETQLEQLTTSILKNLGYIDIATNVIGSGGSEVDVVANYKMPSIEQSNKANFDEHDKYYYQRKVETIFQ